MSKHTQVAPSAIEISHVVIRQDAEGRYCLNDLHRAAGGLQKHSPSRWTRTENYQQLIDELKPEMALDPAITRKGGKSPGIYVVKELVYAYAMWISPKFHLQVIRAYDALQSQPVVQAAASSRVSVDDPVYLKAAREDLCHYVDGCIAAVKSVGATAPEFPLFNDGHVDGLIAERLMSSRMLIYFDDNLQLQMRSVPRDACVISPSDPKSVANFIRQWVPSTPEMLSAISSAFITKFLDCQDAAVERMKSLRSKK